MSLSLDSKHSAFKSLPIVDMSLLFSAVLSDRKQAAKLLDQATREAGFFYLKGHNIAPATIDQLIAAAGTFFAQPHAQKMQSYIGYSNNHSGFVPQGEEVFYGQSADLKEAYDIGPESSSLLQRFEQGGANQWPALEGFREAVTVYYEAMLELSRVLFRGFALALNLPEDTFTQHLSLPPSQLRLVHYFDNPNAQETDSGIGAHTDYEFFTILLPTSPGLQALNGSGEWINIPIVENCFVVNIGDMMELVSGGEYTATSHRVRQVKEERYSFPFFASLDYETPVVPLLHNDADADHDDKHVMICGDHLLAQTIQTFGYLKKRLEAGEIHLPKNAKALSSFGHDARGDR